MSAIVAVPPITAQRRIPIEIWWHIFTFGTEIPGKNEFSMDGDAYHPMEFDDPSILGVPDQSEQIQILKFRLNVVLVCKQWYSTGIRALWSHLWFTRSRRLGPSILQSLGLKPELALYVVRLTIVQDLRTSQTDHDLASITTRIPNARIVKCPIDLITKDSVVRPDILLFQRASSLFISDLGTLPSIIAGIRTLRISLYFKTTLSNSQQLVEFPRLENLYLYSASAGERGQNLTRRWKMPSLRILDLRYSDTSSLYDEFLENHSGSLRKLTLHHPIPYPEQAGRVITMPQLSTLNVTANVISRLYVINAPRLQKLGIFGIGNLSKISNYLDGMVDHLSSVTEISLRFAHKTTSVPLEVSGFDRLRSRGVKLKINP